MGKRIIIGIILIMLLVLPVACREAPTEAATVKIGVVNTNTGGFAFYAEWELDGMKLAVKEINDSGGILGGKKVELIIYDDEGLAEKARTIAERLCAQDKVKGILSGSSPEVSAAIQSVAKKYGIPMAAGCGMGEIYTKGSYWGSVGTNNDLFSCGLIEASAVTKLGAKRIAVIHDNTDLEREACEGVRQRFAEVADGPEFVTEVVFPMEETDFTVPVTKLLATPSDAIIMLIHIKGQVSVVHRLLYERGYKGARFAHVHQLYPDMVEEMPEVMEGTYAPVIWAAEIDDPHSREFIRAFEEMFGRPPFNAPQRNGYLAAKVLIESMDIAGTDSDLKKIADVMHTPRIPDLSGGLLTFHELGTIQSTYYYILEVVNHKIVFIPELGGKVYEVPEFGSAAK